ncbi:Protein sip5 [Erysiphe neolycopersici]|uniref:Protein sip5 n=1 Tax=Erysiphe neolycopersici TaxID=212602 RepID=A0A420HKH7_9PEZI|nr:Protein sip5 [Erysiphe neolycopersici]
MGNNSTRETRGPDLASVQGNNEISSAPSPSASSAQRNHSQTHTSRQGRENRADLFILGLGSGSNNPLPERRETKQERDARKLEKERQARVIERERSLKEEHVDGGFLVTMGVYTGVEDFNKAVVRQLIIERRLAPFWRGLNEYSESWTEYQLIAAARGLPIPTAHNISTREALQNNSKSPLGHSDQDLGLTDSILTTPTLAISGESSKIFPSINLASDVAPTPPLNDNLIQYSTSRPRSKTFASLTNSSQGLDYYDIVPKEVNLPHDPYVNGQPIEAFLYKDVIDCPICFLSYPPYLNKTRCCDQPVCSECFVQIKRPDPHPPELNHTTPNHVPGDTVFEVESLVSKSACCPYCQQPDFGVMYEPPGFRRGLIYVNDASENSASFYDVLPSSDKSEKSKPSLLSVTSCKRRMTSISANAPTVITTDRIRPDWAVKLASARSYLARRSAAATALHTAAYLMGNGNTDTRSFNFRSSRFARNIGADIGTSRGSATSAQGDHDISGNVSDQTSLNRKESQRNEAISHMNRIQDIEELMVMEAIRLSLATEEERT